MRLSKRFYRSVTTVEEADGFAVCLDTRPVRTPLGISLRVPTQSLAEAIAAEWQAQEDGVRPETMPLTALAATALDKIGSSRERSEEILASYAASDLLCYWADEPADLRRRQEDLWQPLLDWVRARWRAGFTVTSGVIPVEQPKAAVDSLSVVSQGLNDFELVALAAVTQVSGSLILGVALVCGKVAASEACEIALLDETYQMERWGQDAEAVKRWQGVRDEIVTAARFLALVRGIPRENVR